MSVDTKAVAKRFMALVDKIESKSDADFALQHLKLHNKFLADNPEISQESLLKGMEALYNDR